MTDRRSFLRSSILSFFSALFGVKISTNNTSKIDNVKVKEFNSNIISFPSFRYKRFFIAHRGVHLKQSMAAENSIESIHLAKRAGFECIEFDIWKTADNHLIVMHDQTINRTVLNKDESELKHDIKVEELTLNELKNNFILKTATKENQSKIPTYKEFLIECKRTGLIPFIHNKLKDQPDIFYKELIKTADQIVGKNNYIITSNNQTNQIVRRMGKNEVRLMGVLYQTTFENISKLGNIIMAISVPRFSSEEYEKFVKKSNYHGFITESHADNFDGYMKIYNHGVDIISTDLLAPNLKNQAILINATSDKKFNDFLFSGKLKNNKIKLDEGDTLTLKSASPYLFFGGIYLEIEMSGSCNIKLADQDFNIHNSDMNYYQHQLMVHNSSPNFEIKSNSECTIKKINLKVAKY